MGCQLAELDVSKGGQVTVVHCYRPPRVTSPRDISLSAVQYSLPDQVHRNQANSNSRLIELYSALGYNLPDLPSSTHNSFVAVVNWSGVGHEENENQSMIVCVEKSLFSFTCTIETIPKFMLEQAVSPQTRWKEYSVGYQIDPQNAQFGPHLKVLFLDSGRLWQVLGHLILLAAIGVEKSNNMEIYICGSTPAEYIYGQQRSYWIEQALWLFCYIFPGNPITLYVSHELSRDQNKYMGIVSRETRATLCTHKQRPVSEKEKLLAVLEDFLQRYGETGLEIPSNDEVIETSLKFGPLVRRRLIISLVDQLLEKTASAYLSCIVGSQAQG
ncbi:uncharacterized protein BDR25DRAFT_360341 [Lindgomyces ingoldianus]|uniref:Uncharacterized protein n=1 Tax=Lindgomyces ingoldianus TaxID=673940 RepID=A0ACB6QI42_9PLEO|nr:uncharacterized protein BDR25DRAFT_360341 [Lindgomyces ingoldianus]KAF2465815.1 hypothetical protein BDR25DRAFT_360341 [Lindgomyces ingoldianus]